MCVIDDLYQKSIKISRGHHIMNSTPIESDGELTFLYLPSRSPLGLNTVQVL